MEKIENRWAGLRAEMAGKFDNHLGLSKIGTKRPCFKFIKATEAPAERPLSFSGHRMLNEGFASLESFFQSNKDKKPGSDKNWRWTLQTNLSDENTSPEVLLEKALVLIEKPKAKEARGWANQVPVASGLTTTRAADRRTAIDLVRKRENGFDFIELKLGSDTPLFAAMEILGYGLIYLLFRKHRADLTFNKESPIMNASYVGLQVLAPKTYYNDWKLGWLEHELNDALKTFPKEIGVGGLSMGFSFAAFHDESVVTFENGASAKKKIGDPTHAKALRKAFDSPMPNVWG